jgi:hypothetical protein
MTRPRPGHSRELCRCGPYPALRAGSSSPERKVSSPAISIHGAAGGQLLRRASALRDSGHSAISRRAPIAASAFPAWIVFPAPRPQLPKGAFLIKVGCLRSNLARNPGGKAAFFNNMFPRGGVHFSNLCEVRVWKSLRKSHEHRPQTTVHIGDFSANKPAHKHIGAIPNRAGDREYLATSRVRPPASADWFPGNGRDQRRHRPRAGLQHQSVRGYKSECLSGCQERLSFDTTCKSMVDAECRS